MHQNLPACFDVGKEYGATDYANYKTENPVKKIMELTGGKGVDRVLICGGEKEAVAQAFEVLKL